MVVVISGVGSIVTGSVLAGWVVNGSSVVVVISGVGSIVTGSVLTGWVVGVIGVVDGGGSPVISSCGGGASHCHDQTQTYKNS